jgi:hypothetical protein
MWLRKEGSKLSWRRTPSHRNKWKKKARVGCQRNEACKELPLRRKQQRRSGGAAQERHNERRENGERGDQVTEQTGLPVPLLSFLFIYFFYLFFLT